MEISIEEMGKNYYRINRDIEEGDILPDGNSQMEYATAIVSYDEALRIASKHELAKNIEKKIITKLE